MSDPSAEECEALLTIRDWLRFAVSEFSRARLVYGHGTDNALDEAAFLILSSLELPVHDLESWLDCRLTARERSQVRDLVQTRIRARKPAAYLTKSAWIQSHKFYVDERVIVPRSYLGELLCRDRLATVVADAGAVGRVLDLCTGSGCLAILAALAYPNARVVASDISEAALEVAAKNVRDYGLCDRVRLVHSDLFAAIGQEKFDLILSNPPYVTLAAVKAFAPEYKAEPELAHLGGLDGLDIVRRILHEAPRYLSADGAIVVEAGNARDLLESTRPDLPFLWLDTETSQGEVFALDGGWRVEAAKPDGEDGVQ